MFGTIKIEKNETLSVNWDGEDISVKKGQPKKPFCLWSMSQENFNRLFKGNSPPILVAMNNDQSNIKMGVDHHNGSLVVSFLVILQESMIGGESK